MIVLKSFLRTMWPTGRQKGNKNVPPASIFTSANWTHLECVKFSGQTRMRQSIQTWYVTFGIRMATTFLCDRG